ncbi:hypothetical protein LSAT2_008278 [Lamellibrachia satsuma]|nr:hypothetical protein LSAT2_008278 [Lamellibrachia satsuma]
MGPCNSFTSIGNDGENPSSPSDLTFGNSQPVPNPVQAIDQLKRGSVPAEERVSPRALVDHIMARADNDHDNKLSKQEFISGALSSKTIQRMLVGTLAASSSPFAHRRKMAKQ